MQPALYSTVQWGKALRAVRAAAAVPFTSFARSLGLTREQLGTYEKSASVPFRILGRAATEALVPMSYAAQFGEGQRPELVPLLEPVNYGEALYCLWEWSGDSLRDFAETLARYEPRITESSLEAAVTVGDYPAMHYWTAYAKATNQRVSQVFASVEEWAMPEPGPEFTEGTLPERLLAALREHPNSGIGDLHALVGGTHSSVQQELSRLFLDGKVSRPRRGIYKLKFVPPTPVFDRPAPIPDDLNTPKRRQKAGAPPPPKSILVLGDVRRNRKKRLLGGLPEGTNVQWVSTRDEDLDEAAARVVRNEIAGILLVTHGQSDALSTSVAESARRKGLPVHRVTGKGGDALKRAAQEAGLL